MKGASETRAAAALPARTCFLVLSSSSFVGVSTFLGTHSVCACTFMRVSTAVIQPLTPSAAAI